MDIAIIGAGNVGRSLATAFVRAGHDVDHRLARSARTPRPLAAATGATVAASNAKPPPRHRRRRPRGPVQRAPRTSPTEIGDAVAGKVVVDVIEPDVVRCRRSGHRHRRPPTPRNSPRCCPRRDVVKAFNTLFASNQATRSPTASSSTATSPPMTTPPRAIVLELVESIGLTPGRCRSARPCPSARGARLPQHHPEHRQRRQLAVRLEARRRPGRPGGRPHDRGRHHDGRRRMSS